MNVFYGELAPWWPVLSQFGLFPTATWVRVLEQAGFRVEVAEEETAEDRVPRLLFFGHAPEAA